MILFPCPLPSQRGGWGGLKSTKEMRLSCFYFMLQGEQSSSGLPAEVLFTGRRLERSSNGGSYLMNTVRFKFQSEICDLKSEINMMLLELSGH
jgi:hypothetical protein